MKEHRYCFTVEVWSPLKCDCPAVHEELQGVLGEWPGFKARVLGGAAQNEERVTTQDKEKP